MFTVDEINKELGCDFVTLVHEPEGNFWYFVYNDGLFISTHTVDVDMLTDLEFGMWLDIGRDFNERLIEEAIDRDSKKDDWKWENIAANH